MMRYSKRHDHELLAEIATLRDWVDSYPPVDRVPEWESTYPYWDQLYTTTLNFIEKCPSNDWSEQERRALVYVLAADNDTGYIASEVGARWPDLLLPLTQSALCISEDNALWQLALQLGQHVALDSEVESVLINLADFPSELVRRHALLSPSNTRSGSTGENRIGALVAG